MGKSADIKLSNGQQRAHAAAMDGRNLFITGPGGVGKSEVLRVIIEDLRSCHKLVAVTASTGISALRVEGGTVHSFMMTGIMGSIEEVQAALKRGEWIGGYKRDKMLRRIHTLVVDEVSMLTGDYIDMVDWRLKTAKRSNLPFGGVQVIFCGDFLQLPPVIVRDERRVGRKYAFSARAWAGAGIEHVFLTENFRQDDEELQWHLGNVRIGRIPRETADYFNRRVGVELSDPTRLYSTNVAAGTLNKAMLVRLPGRARVYGATMVGEKRYFERLAGRCIAEQKLRIKVGAPVLLLRNNRALGYVNGDRGRVVGINSSTKIEFEKTPGAILVEKMDGKVIEVSPTTWSFKSADGRVRAEMKQYPLKLAWAMTIHKSQGMTLELMECDVSKCFEAGQAYVALSRMKSIDGLSLTEPLDSGSVMADQKIVKYYEWKNGRVPTNA